MIWLLLVLVVLAIWLLEEYMRRRWSPWLAKLYFKRKQTPLFLEDVEVEGRRIRVAWNSAREDLPTLVFIHGSPGSWRRYRQYMTDKDLCRKFRIAAIDRPGFGHSNFGQTVRLHEQSELIMPVLKKIKTRAPMYLIGSSMGGPVVVKLAADHPDFFYEIVIVAGALAAHLEPRERWRYVMEHSGLRWMLPGAFRPSNTELLALKQDLVPLEKDFEKVTCGVHFIHGDRDTWVPIENVDFGKQMLINARWIKSDTLLGAGHKVSRERYDEFKHILLQLA